mgnify:CR=1 FL=1
MSAQLPNALDSERAVLGAIILSPSLYADVAGIVHMRNAFPALLAELRAARAELDRWRHGRPIEGDHVCPDSLALTEARGRIAAEVARFAASAEGQKYASDQGTDLAASTPEQLTAHIRTEITKWDKVVRDAGVKLE